ncbi:MAG: cation-translocating P-type ATPase [Candidatus Diapherotrites archaeon]|nr:cation-translocating P-type ATPase [Candidatus Diapherotrites archaeon]
MKWHIKSVDRIFKELETSKQGLSLFESASRLKKYGLNVLEEKQGPSAVKIFLSQFRNFLVLILIAAAVVSFIAGHMIDTCLIAAIVFINGVFGFVQDYRAEKSIEALKKMIVKRAVVIRDDREMVVDAGKLVPGDIIVFGEGEAIPADARIIEAVDLKVDESALTGESMGSNKHERVIFEDACLAERANMVFMGTNVLRGSGMAVVVATGMKTEVGSIAEEVNRTEQKPASFQVEINTLGKKIGFGLAGLVVLIVLVQFVFYSEKFLEAGYLLNVFMVSISLAVAAIPEGLPAVVTFALAVGTQRMVRKNAVVRRLPVVETLGSVDVICTDKTGTITENKMVIQKLFFNGKTIDVVDRHFLSDGNAVGLREMIGLLECGVLCNNAYDGISFDGKEGLIGDPTETSLLDVAAKAGIDVRELRAQKQRLKEFSFSSERKRMSVICGFRDFKISFVKGAPEVILSRCNKVLVDGREVLLSESRRKEILGKSDEFALQSLRVLAFASRKVAGISNDSAAENGLVFLGLQAMMDPPRQDVPGAVKLAHSAGIRVIMLTGDNKLTAKVVAERVGIGTVALDGNEIDLLSDSEFSDLLPKVNVFARLSPSHKVRILKLLQASGHRVVMTGDGVNDVPALKMAEVGVAMGIRGTDVAKCSADMIILDDDFSDVVASIKEGRTIFANIRKFVNLLLTCNFSEVILVLFTSFLGFFPLGAVQILWVNLLTDGLPAIALGADPPKKDVMKVKPRDSGENIINKQLVWLVAIIGFKIGLLLIALFFVSVNLFGLEAAKTIVFTALVFYELLLIAAIRHQEKTPFFSNKWLNLALIVALGLHVVLLYTPLGEFFSVVPLTLEMWTAIAVTLAVGWVLTIALTKAVVWFVPKKEFAD